MILFIISVIGIVFLIIPERLVNLDFDFKEYESVRIKIIPLLLIIGLISLIGIIPLILLLILLVFVKVHDNNNEKVPLIIIGYNFIRKKLIGLGISESSFEELDNILKGILNKIKNKNEFEGSSASTIFKDFQDKVSDKSFKKNNTTKDPFTGKSKKNKNNPFE